MTSVAKQLFIAAVAACVLLAYVSTSIG